jgi:hypothetical protein
LMRLCGPTLMPRSMAMTTATGMIDLECVADIISQHRDLGLARNVYFRRNVNQEKHFDCKGHFQRITASTPIVAPSSERNLCAPAFQAHGRSAMSGQVILYFDDQADALRFALAAGSVMAGEGGKFTSDLVEETARVNRIRLDAVNAGAVKKTGPVRAA